MQHQQEQNRIELGEASANDRQICCHFGDDQQSLPGAAVPPIFQTAPFVYPSYEALTAALQNEKHHYVYSRGTNPTVDLAERKLAELEGGEACKCFASGMAAIAAAILSSVSAGDHVLAVGQVYESTLHLLDYLQKFGIRYTQIASTETNAIEEAVRREPQTRLLYLESPTSHTFRLVNLLEVAEFARSKGIRTVVDNTWATPLYQKPLRLGIDLVVQAASKYLSGHNDVVAGALIGPRAMIDRAFYDIHQLFGASVGPLEAWLLIRGLRTLPLRMKGHQQGALQVARYLDTHPAVARVNHPGLNSHPQHELALRQLAGFSGLFSIELKDASFQGVCTFINRLRRFKISVSFGSFESQAIGASYGYNEEELRRWGINPATVRLSIGLEPPELLIEDLENALLPGGKHF